MHVVILKVQEAKGLELFNTKSPNPESLNCTASATSGGSS